ncbi:MAG TPA: family 10 glycosylhydrolase [Candidatus Paceibacterota bacterium]|nr:family 10 glycosylhydrolase [Verrucomicrobiota bacterium]HSA09670.1 family 10 glycosylhydrolase [Candidatus Paceibacterota bacterium]
MNELEHRHQAPTPARRPSFLSLTAGRAASLAIVILICFATLATAAEWRAFWVDAWGAGFLKQSEVDTLLGVPGTSTAGRIRDANCNAVFVQVRRNCDACYPSSMGEPYMGGLTPSNFNALQAIINAAHDTTGGKKRIEVHCWMVTFRTSGGTVYKRHIDSPTGSLTNLDNYWPSLDDAGAEVGDRAFDPGHPLVLQYTVGVAMDLVNNFDIDGIHYDYVRFTASDQGYNPTSIARYNARYGLTGQPSPSNEQFKQWRRDQVSAVVRQVYARIQKTKPWVKQSGSFVTWNPSPVDSTREAFMDTRPYYDVYCDWDSWVEEGIVDMAVPMTYYRQHELPNDYLRWINFEKDRTGNRHMIIGPGIYMNYLTNAILHLQMTRTASPAGNYAHGFSGYSYRSPYLVSPKPLTYGDWAIFAPPLVADVTPSWDDIPSMPWKTSPVAGHLMGTVYLGNSGAWADGATVSVTGPTNRTMFVDGTGFYAFIDLPPGRYAVTASKTNYPSGSGTVDVAVGQVTGNMYELDFDLGGTFPPAITGQPQSVTIAPGKAISFAVAATGSRPLSYQWRLGGTALPGATTSVLNIPFVRATDVGAYSVLVTNALGEALSTDAILTIMPVAAWGDDTFGQCNTPATTTNAVAVAAGAWHTLALRADGRVVGWEDEAYGQCAVPSSLRDAVAIAAGGYHSLALRSDGTVVAWGANDYGQTNVPAKLSDVIAIAAGTWHSVALRADGTVVMWGDNGFGQTNQPAGLNGVTAVAAGGNHTLALRTNGTVVAWGENTDAEGRIAGQSVVPSGLANVRAVAAGEYHSLAVKTDGTVEVWGDNSQGQCDKPQGLANVVAVTGGGAHSVALHADGALTPWGANWNSQCEVPSGLSAVAAVAAGTSHTVVLLEGAMPVPRLLNPAWNGSRFSASVQTLARMNYALEYKDSPTAATWTCVCTNSGNGALRILTDPSASGASRFYRMRQW